MAQTSLEARFHGTVALATLHLRRLAKSNDRDAGLAAARAMGMLGEEQESFMRECFDIDERLTAGEIAADALVQDVPDRLQRCILSINSADPA